jgi:hypothetical protein
VGLLAFLGTPEKVEEVVEGIQRLGFAMEKGKGMGVTMIWGRLFPPDFKVRHHISSIQSLKHFSVFENGRA